MTNFVPSADIAAIDPLLPSECPPAPVWRYFLLTALLSACFSFLIHVFIPQSSSNPCFTTTLVFLWWALLSYLYLRQSLGNALTMPVFLHWLLQTPRLRLCCLTALLLGLLLCSWLGMARLSFITLGLVWPAFFISQGIVRRVRQPVSDQLLFAGCLILWLLGELALNQLYGMMIHAAPFGQPATGPWLALTGNSTGRWYMGCQLLCGTVPATLFFLLGWLDMGGDTLVRKLPLRLPEGERGTTRSLLVKSIRYAVTVSVLFCLALIVALGPLYAHPQLAMLLAFAVMVVVNALALTRPGRRWLACAISSEPRHGLEAHESPERPAEAEASTQAAGETLRAGSPDLASRAGSPCHEVGWKPMPLARVLFPLLGLLDSCRLPDDAREARSLLLHAVRCFDAGHTAGAVCLPQLMARHVVHLESLSIHGPVHCRQPSIVLPLPAPVPGLCDRSPCASS